MERISLNVPKDFTSSMTYQNIHYTFPHNEGLALSYTDLKNWFFKDNYIIPDYIQYSNPDFDGDIYNVINLLKSNENFSVLGVSYMRLKTLEEKIIDYDIFDIALDWKMNKSHRNPNIQQKINTYITEENKNNMVVVINNVLNYVQVMIIDIIYYCSKYSEFPDWLYYDITSVLIDKLNQFVVLKMMEIAVSITIYLSNIIPLLNDVENILINNYQLILL